MHGLPIGFAFYGDKRVADGGKGARARSMVMEWRLPWSI
jgi:hypothetical protein